MDSSGEDDEAQFNNFDASNDATNINDGSSSTKQRRGRGPAKGFSSAKGPPLVIDQWGLNGEALGPYASKFASYLGQLVRSRVNINSSWEKVSNEMKDQIWSELKHEYIVDESKKKKILTKMGIMHKSFKTKLRGKYITGKIPMGKNKNKPWDAYNGIITEDDWSKFVEHSNTEEFKKLSELNSQRASTNMFPHYMGRDGYMKSIEKWEKSGLVQHFVNQDTESSGISTANSRYIHWLCTRTRLDDKQELVCPNPMVEPLLKKLDEVKESVAKGDFVPHGKDDILSAIVGKPDHPGRTRGMGGVEGYSEVFGRGKRSVFADKLVFSEEQVRQMEKKIESRLMDQMRLELQEQLSQAGIQVDGASAKTFSPGMQESKCSNINARVFSFNDGDNCCLGLKNDDDMVEIVAHADVYHTLPTQTLHNIPMLPNHLRVNIKMVKHGFERRLLPVGIESADISLLAEAEGTFVQWPSDLVFVGEAPKEHQLKKAVKPKVIQKPPQMVLGNPLVDDINKLCGDVLEIHEILALFDPEQFQFLIPLPRNLFHYPSDEEFSSIVIREDLRQFCNGDSLNISIIQVFILCMSSKMQADGVTSIGFLCPEICSHARLTNDRTTTRNYIVKVLTACFNKNLVLFPYHQSSHWILIVICPRTSTAFIFDPAKTPNILVHEDLRVAFRVAAMTKNERFILPKIFERVKCRKQPGATECGYYVMRYMYDIINNYHNSDNIGRDWIAQQRSPYPTHEIDEVRDVWARYFLDFLVN